MKYLKFDSEAQFKTAFAEHMIKTEDGETLPPYIGDSAVDVVGVIHDERLCIRRREGGL